MQLLLDALLRNARGRPDTPTFADDEVALTHGAVAARVAALAATLVPEHRILGLLAPNGVAWAVAQLACACAGRTVVPLPTFFSAAQLAHVIRDASLDCILVAPALTGRVAGNGVAVQPLDIAGTAELRPESADGFAQVIYTSGSTGAPKGVRHGAAQIGWMAEALAHAVAAHSEDLYLSVLPLPLLLETLCAVFVPVLAGARARFETGIPERLGTGQLAGLAEAFGLHRPTMSVLVPQVLAAWVGELDATGAQAPASLRFVAVGGAPVPPALAERAWRAGIPACEGYGLSECGSVVAVNAPGQRRPGSVGRPLPGITVSIVDGEILVDGPTLMDGYLGRERPPGPWRTGDLGSIDADGFLHVHGRKDNLIVLSSGRNVSPEWIETILLGDPCVAACGIVGHGMDRLTAVIVPTAHGEARFAASGPDEHLAFVQECCAQVPAHAVPGHCLVVSRVAAIPCGLLTPNGRIARGPLNDLAARRADPALAISA
ncbi:AMP-binding protein [Methylobacterium sp. NEAU K]|uniref:AMP-binding protein n=1 Tax=Methylobacterium sp. NEAU K TaxID=3064946 RepID=UPI002736CDB5|nr:AMP-binding protein [Methylobacterium sp. NEAU K]MDP4006565.1 AMP-binding protein [Methylobacterium sp. NEAU K]